MVKHRKVSKYYETDRDWGGKVFIWNKPLQRLLAGSPELCKSKTLDLQKHQNHQTKQTLKEKNRLGKGTNKSWKPNTPKFHPSDESNTKQKYIIRRKKNSKNR